MYEIISECTRLTGKVTLIWATYSHNWMHGNPDIPLICLGITLLPWWSLEINPKSSAKVRQENHGCKSKGHMFNAFKKGKKS